MKSPMVQLLLSEYDSPESRIPEGLLTFVVLGQFVRLQLVFDVQHLNHRLSCRKYRRCNRSSDKSEQHAHHGLECNHQGRRKRYRLFFDQRCDDIAF
jgi:hypothetical protein